MTATPRQARRYSPPARYGFALVTAAAAALLEVSLNRTLGWHYQFVAFAPAIAFAAWFGGLGPGLIAIAFSVAASLRLDLIDNTVQLDRADAIALVIFGGCWLVVTLLAGRVYQRLTREGEWRMAAERMAAHADRLEQFTAAVAAARTPQAAIEAMLQEALYALQADAGALLLLGEDQQLAHLQRAVGYPPETSGRWRSVSLAAGGPMADAVTRRSCVLLASDDPLADQYGEQAAGFCAGYQATAVVPLVVGGRAIGLLRLDFARTCPFGADERQFLAAIAPRAAQALDRATQYEAAQHARAEAERERARADEELAERQRAELALRASETRYRALAARTTRLHEMSTALSDAVSLDAVTRAIAHYGKIVVGATAAAVTLLSDDERLQTVCAEDGEGQLTGPQEPIQAVAGLSLTAAVESRKPVLIRSFAEWQQLHWHSAAIAADGGYESSAALPLLIEGRPIGVVEFHFTVPVHFDDEYCGLLASVAQHCAQAVDRARAYESAQRDRAEAERANRLKDEFLSVVSHELRTPLNSIAGWASMLQKGQLDGALSARALKAIRDNARRQAQLIDELLDFSRIVAGRVRLDMREVELPVLLAGVAESMLSLASTKGVELQVRDLPAVVVLGDPRRLEQVFFNLLGNALKFTPQGGRVSVRARADVSAVAVSVEDNGIGIPEEFLPHVFDRFRQADSTISRNFGGLGLGLSIAKQLIGAHSGHITAASGGRGHGATFTVVLPLASARPAVTVPAALPPTSKPSSYPVQ
ncbi:MAG: ATP-binding protein [Bacteroidales bacterium]